MSGAGLGITPSGARIATVQGLTVLKSPEEGGTKKQYDDFLDKLQNHLMIGWIGGRDISLIVKNNEPDIPEPVDLTSEEKTSDWKKVAWTRKVEKYGERVDLLDENKGALYSLLMDNITTITKGKVKSKEGYQTAEDDKNPTWLLSTLEDIMVNFEEVQKKAIALDNQVKRIVNIKQAESSNEDFVKLATKELKLLEKRGSTYLWVTDEILRLKTMVDTENKTYKDSNDGQEMSADQLIETTSRVRKALKEELISLVILQRSDKNRYGSLQKSLANSFLIGRDEYPKTIGAVLKLLNNYQQETIPSANANGGEGGNDRATSVSFLQSSGAAVTHLKGTNNSFYPGITCRICGLKGHFQSHCPIATATTPENRVPRSGNDDNTTGQQEVSFHRSGILLNQHSDTHINPNWVLLDSESTDHIFCNKSFLTDVGPTTDGESLRLHTSGGSLDTHQKGRFGGFTVWYNPNCLANILSLALVSDQYRVTLDTETENAFSVHISAGHVMKFIRFFRDCICLMLVT